MLVEPNERLESITGTVDKQATEAVCFVKEVSECRKGAVLGL